MEPLHHPIRLRVVGPNSDVTAPQDTVIPLEISIRFEDLPRLARLVVPAVTGTPLAYRLDGSFTVEAGALGSQRFGPRTLLTGQIRVR